MVRQMHLREANGSILSVAINGPLDQSKSNQELLLVKLISRSEAYQKSISHQEICQMASNSPGMELAEFYDNTVTALTTADPSFRVEMLGDTLSWYSVLEFGIVLLLGQLNMDTIEPFDLYDFSLELVREYAAQRADLEQVTKSEANLMKQRDLASQKYENYINEREKSDVILFDKFTNLLNQKKAKIAELMASKKQKT